MKSIRNDTKLFTEDVEGTDREQMRQKKTRPKTNSLIQQSCRSSSKTNLMKITHCPSMNQMIS